MNSSNSLSQFKLVSMLTQYKMYPNKAKPKAKVIKDILSKIMQTNNSERYKILKLTLQMSSQCKSHSIFILNNNNKTHTKLNNKSSNSPSIIIIINS